MNLELAVRILGGRMTGPNSALVQCCSHEDRNPSLSLRNAEDKELWKCFAGCDSSSVYEELLRLGIVGRSSSVLRSKGSEVPPKRGLGKSKATKEEETIPCTPDNYYEKTRLSLEVIKPFGCEFSQYGLLHPYYDTSGNVYKKYRKHIIGQPKFLWASGTPKPAPYIFNLQNVQHYSENDFYLNIVEGESDALTLAVHGFAAIGISGANAVRKDLSDILRLFKSLFVFKEPDQGGKKFVESILDLDLGITSSAKVIAMPPVAKDINELFKLDTTGFKNNYRRLIA